MTDRRVQFDFDVEFSNGGSLKGEGFRLDIEGDDISDRGLADYIVRDLRLLMVGTVRIRNKTILTEPHRRSRSRLVDVSHEIEDGMITYRGLPGPVISDYWTREASRSHFAPGTEFHIGRIDMVANTGTYVDSPFHRHADGPDLAALPLESLADLPGVVVRVAGRGERGIDVPALAGLEVRGKAVLLHTGWDRPLANRPLFRWPSVSGPGGRRVAGGSRRRARRHRLPEHRRHLRSPSPGAQHPPAREHPHRRAPVPPRSRCPTRASASSRCRRRCVGSVRSRSAPSRRSELGASGRPRASGVSAGRRAPRRRCGPRSSPGGSRRPAR